MPAIEGADFLEKSVHLDPKFTLAYCACEEAQDLLYFWYDPSPERLARADQAVRRRCSYSLIFPKFVWPTHAIFTMVIGTTMAPGNN